MSPLVSVVLPTYNRSEDLKRALISIVNQTYTNWEVLIIDNESADDTVLVANSFRDPRIKLFSINNKGLIAASRNMGMLNSNGKYIAFLDSDDWWCPEKLEISVKYLEKGFDLVYHDLYLVRKKTQKIFLRKSKSRKLNGPIYTDLLENGNGINNSSVVFRKEIMRGKSLPVIRELNPICDFDAWLFISKITNKFYKIPKTLGYLWLGGGNYTNLSRTLSSINFFEEYYALDLKQEHFGKKGWILYIKGRAYFLMKKNKEARQILESIAFKPKDLIIYTKARWMLAVNFIYKN